MPLPSRLQRPHRPRPSAPPLTALSSSATRHQVLTFGRLILRLRIVLPDSMPIALLDKLAELLPVGAAAAIGGPFVVLPHDPLPFVVL